MKKFVILTCLFFSTYVYSQKKKSVFIILDGIPADVIERVPTPAIDEISAKGGYTRAYMGGEVGGITQTPTVSAVCYNSLLTATWANKHNVWGNEIKNPNYNYWNIFRIAKSQPVQVKTAIFSAWLDNRTKLIGEGKPEAGNIKMDYFLDGLELDTVNYPPEDNSMHIFKIDEEISKAAAKCIKEEAPDVTWVYLWYLDCVGHEFGDGPNFDKYTNLADKQVERIWESIKYREEKFKEEWMIVVTTDHGRTAKDGKGHGGQSERERTTWISTNIKPNTYFFNKPGIVDIVPSISKHMNFIIPKELDYEQEGVPFIGKIDISNPKAERTDNQVTISWENFNNTNVEIFVTPTNNFKEGENDQWVKIGKVKAKENKFVFDLPKKDSSFYKFSLRTKENTLSVWSE